LPNAADPDSATVSAPVDEPPELLSVKVCDAVVPASTLPKSKAPLVDGVNVSAGGEPATPAAGAATTAVAASSAARIARVDLR
jgi:hypothetical protein